MNLDEIVGEVTERHGRDMVLNLFREGVSQSSEPAHCHPNRQVMTFDVAGVDVLRVGVADDGMALASQAYGGAVPLFSAFGYTVDLNQHRVIDIARKRLVNSLDVHLKAITGKLNAIRETARKVFDEVPSAFRVPLADQPARHQLGIGVNCGPEPRIARAGVLCCNIFRNGLLFAVAKGPAFINLHPFAFEVLEDPILVLSAEGADFIHEPHDGLFRHAGYADSGAHGVAFNQATNDLGTLFGSEAVHASIMHYRLRIVKCFSDMFSNYFQVAWSFQ